MHNFLSTSELVQAFRKIALGSAVTSKSRARPAAEGRCELKDLRMPRKEGKPTIRCYNCNIVGHHVRDCRKPQRSRGSCYRCGKLGHLAKDCYDKPAEGKEVANIESMEDENEFQKNIVYRISTDGANFVLSLITLLDTGSPISFIKEQFVKGIYDRNNSESIGSLCGINKSKLVVRGHVTASITLNGQTKENICLLVVPDDTMTACAVLGRDVLRMFRLHLTDKSIAEEAAAVNAIMNINFDSPTDTGADLLQINSNVDDFVRLELKQLFNEFYIRPERPAVPEVKSDLRLTVNNIQPFHFQPRRLSYSEKDRLHILLDDLLAKKIIRPSKSEYALPIVLITKKNGKLQMCVDYRTLNKHLARDNHPLPLIEDQLMILNNKKYFSRLDLKDDSSISTCIRSRLNIPRSLLLWVISNI